MTTIEDIRFPTPDEIEGFWAFDKMHAPRPLHPLSQDLVMSTLAVGFTKAQAEYDSPVVASNQAINHYFFMSFHPHPDEGVIADRMSRYLDTLNAKVPLVGKRWTNEWLPMIRDRNEAERDVDYSEMSDEELLAKFDDMTDWMIEMWYIHGHINFALLSGAALSDMYQEVMQPEDPTESYQILQGHHTRPVDAAHGLWDLSRVVKNSPALIAVFDETPTKDLPAKLAQSEEGREFLEKLEKYLYDFGWRSDAVYDLADVPWRENPVIPLGAVARYVNMPDSDDPMIQFERAVKLREELTDRIRTKLEDDPERLAKFEELYDAARYAYPLTEDHAFYIDQMGVVLFRRFVCAVGAALARNGVIDEGDDVFFLHKDEVRGALVERWRPARDRQPAPRRGEGRGTGHAARCDRHSSPATAAGRLRRSLHRRRRHPPARHQAAAGGRAGPEPDRRRRRFTWRLHRRRTRRALARSKRATSRTAR